MILFLPSHNRDGAIEVESSYWDERVSHHTATQAVKDYKELVCAILDQQVLGFHRRSRV